MSDERLGELERQIHDAIGFHREQYERAIKPLIDQLVRLQSFRTPVLVLSRDQFDSLSIQPFEPPKL